MKEDEILPCLRKHKDKQEFDHKCRELIVKREIAENKGMYWYLKKNWLSSFTMYMDIYREIVVKILHLNSFYNNNSIRLSLELVHVLPRKYLIKCYSCVMK